jgi:phage portal protein BeeE
MNFFDRVLNPFGYVSQKQFDHRLSEAVKSEIDKKLPKFLGETADAQKWAMPDPAIFANQADMYRLSPILGTAVSILGSDIGTAKVNVKRMVGEELRDIPNHDYETLLRNPNPADSGLELMQYTVSNYLLNGNAVRWLNKADKDAVPEEIWTIPYSMITPIPDSRMYVDHYDYFPGNGKKAIPLETWEIVHYKAYNPNNRFVGLSPLESLAVTLQGDLAMRRTNTVNYAEYGGAPQSILAFKEYVNEPAWSDIKAEKRQAAKRNEMMMLRGVGDGVTWMQRALSNKDMDFVAGLRQNLTDVFNRMCPGLIAMLSENATEANALAARATYAEKTQWPMMEVIAQKDTSDVLPAYGRKLIMVFDDPRVVDKKLKLEEQTAYERTHTLKEVRKEYYQDDPIGDERDDLLPSQIKGTIGVDVPPPPVPPGQVPPVQPPTQAPPAENMPPEMQAQKAMNEDLARWQRLAIRKNGKAVTFDSDVIPVPIQRKINRELFACKSEADIKRVFANIRHVEQPAQNDAAIKALAESIDKAVDMFVAEPASTSHVYNMNMPAISLTTTMPERGETIINFPEQPAPITQLTVNTPEQPAPVNNIIVNNPEQPAPLTQVTVNNPEQPAPVTEVTINTPEQPAPVVNFQADVHVPEQPAPVTDIIVNNEQPKSRKKIKIVKNDDGSFTGESDG